MSTQATSTVPSGAQTFDAIYPGFAFKLSLSTTVINGPSVPAGISVALLTSDVDCFIAIGQTPVAKSDGSSTYLPAKVPMLFAINTGDQISAIVGSSTGNLYITAGG